MKKARNKKTARKYRIFALVILIALAISAARLYWEEDLSGIYAPDCGIEYGHGKCIDGILAIPFYNPNTRDITSMKITVPRGIETNVSLPATFNVNLPLSPGKSGVLKLVACRNYINTADFQIDWCCGSDCYKTKMSRPNEELRISGE